MPIGKQKVKSAAAPVPVPVPVQTSADNSAKKSKRTIRPNKEVRHTYKPCHDSQCDGVFVKSEIRGKDFGYGVGVKPIVGNKRKITEDWDRASRNGKNLSINMKRKRKIRVLDEDGHHSDWRVYDSKTDNTLYLVRRTKANPSAYVPIEITNQTAEDLRGAGKPKSFPVKREDLPQELLEEELLALYTAQALLAFANRDLFKEEKAKAKAKAKEGKKEVKKNAKQSVPGVVTRSRNKSKSKQSKSSAKKSSKKSDSSS